MKLPFGHHRDGQVIHLDEDVYVVIGDSARVATDRSAWPATGSYGAIPRDGVIGMLDEVIGAIGPELWRAKRRGEEVCMVAPLTTYDISVALLWGADCVEHLARRVNGVDGNVVETLALARRYARERKFQPEAAPGQVKAIHHGDAPEAEWQAKRLDEYLKRTDDEPSPFARW